VSAAGEIYAALAVSGPEPRFSVETAESWLPELSAAAERLEPWIESD
jgi:DNA-binding IclR family transcriptional regulator